MLRKHFIFIFNLDDGLLDSCRSILDIDSAASDTFEGDNQLDSGRYLLPFFFSTVAL
jgi:hypothetical protein